jgi:hypothetical protein
MYFTRPCETEIPSPLNPALKRRATIRRPFGTRVKVQPVEAIKVRSKIQGLMVPEGPLIMARHFSGGTAIGAAHVL